MSDVVYSVEVQYLTSGSLKPAQELHNSVNGMKSSVKSMMSGLEGFAGKFNGALDSIGGKLIEVGVGATAALGGAIATGLGLAGKAAFKFNEELENTQLSLAAISSANGGGNLGQGMMDAGQIIKQMRKDAAQLPGEFKDLSNMMATISSAGMQSGMGLEGIEKMAAKGMMAAEVLGGMNQQTAARELAMMLEGNARHAMPMWSKLGVQDAAGNKLDTKTFNAMDAKSRRKLLEANLARIATPLAIDSAAKSWTGIKSTAIDNLRQGAGMVFSPLFESVKSSLSAFNDWVGKGGNKLAQWGETLGNAINNAFLGSLQFIKHWGPMVLTFAENLYNHLKSVFARLEPYIKSIGSHLYRFLGDPEAVHKLVGAVSTLAGLRMAGGVAQAGFGVASLGGAGAAAAAGPVLGVVATLAAAFYGIQSVLLDTSSVFHGIATTAAGSIMGGLKELAEHLINFGVLIQPVVNMLATTLLESLKLVVQGMNGIMILINGILTGATEAAKGAKGWVHQKLVDAGLVKDLDTTNEAIDPARKAFVPMHLFSDDGKAIKEKEAPKPPQHTTHVHKVEINVNSNQDPTRIAKKTADIFHEWTKHPRSATNTGIPLFTR